MILRKPSGSHWVQNTPFETYRPSSAVFAAGLIRTVLSRVHACGQVVHDQMVGVDLVAVAAERLAVQPQLEQLQLLTVEDQGTRALARRGVAPHGKARRDLGVGRPEAELQIDLIDQVVGRPIVLEADGLRGLRVFGHDRSFAASAEARNLPAARHARNLPTRAPPRTSPAGAALPRVARQLAGNSGRARPAVIRDQAVSARRAASSSAISASISSSSASPART